MTQNRSILKTLVAGLALSGLVGGAFQPTLAQPPAQDPTPGQNIAQEKPRDAYETARLNPKLKTFVSLVDAAGLADTLRGKGPYTILAPVNDAFDKVPASTLADLKRPENKEKLANLLKSHIILGRYTSGDLANQEDKALLRTVGGSPVTLTKLPRARFNNSAGVYAADIPAENGVIHIVDAVLMPMAGADMKNTNTTWTPGRTKAGDLPRPFDEPEKDRNKPSPSNPNPPNPLNPNRPYP